jgi:outer membrane protein assembly factor BamB
MNTRIVTAFASLLLATTSLALAAAKPPATGWYQWRGPEQNGVSREKNLPDKWDLDSGENLVWENEVGGMSSPIVMNGKVYTYTRIGEVEANDTLVAGQKTQDAIVAIDAKTGKVLWTHAENMTQTDVPFHRLGWSNVVGDPETGRVYGLGAQCTLVCLDGETGKPVWKRQMTEEFGMISTFGGRTPSPAIDEDQLFVGGVAFGWGDHARSNHRLFCFDKTTGELRWSEGTGGIPVDSPYNTPVISNIAGQRTVVLGAGDGTVAAFQARTGKKLWTHKVSKRGLNASVVVEGDMIYACSSEENVASATMGAVVCIDASGDKPKETWRRDGIEAGFGSPTLVNGRLYVIDNGAQVFALDAKTGKTFWKKRAGTIGKASLAWGDGKIYVPEANGRFVVLKDEGNEAKVVFKSDLEEKLGREYSIFGSVAIADGRIFLQAANRMFCIGAKEPKEVASDPIPGQPEEKKGSDKVALVQVLPYDVVAHPGDKVQLRAKTFNELGQVISTEAKPAWSIGQLTFIPPPKALPDRPPAKEDDKAPAARGGESEVVRPVFLQVQDAAKAPPAPTAEAPVKIGNLTGEIGADGAFTAAAPAGQHQGGAVVATIGDKAGYARVRVLPKLPWTFDFEKAPVDKPPLTWLGAGGKFAVRELEGNKVLTKLTDIDLYARARTNFGTVDMAGNTLQADVRVGKKMSGSQAQMPDAAIINNRYVLVLLGNHQSLEVHAWPSALPEAWHQRIPFKWEADKWYRLKLKVSDAGGKALVEGKAWSADAPEPETWNIRVEDQKPNAGGAPGLYGNSLVTPTKSEIYYDNITLTPNK